MTATNHSVWTSSCGEGDGLYVWTMHLKLKDILSFLVHQKSISIIIHPCCLLQNWSLVDWSRWIPARIVKWKASHTELNNSFQNCTQVTNRGKLSPLLAYGHSNVGDDIFFMTNRKSLPCLVMISFSLFSSQIFSSNYFSPLL